MKATEAFTLLLLVLYSFGLVETQTNW